MLQLVYLEKTVYLGKGWWHPRVNCLGHCTPQGLIYAIQAHGNSLIPTLASAASASLSSSFPWE